jgi:hypothetical protein
LEIEKCSIANAVGSVAIVASEVNDEEECKKEF